jgi:2-octaprenylphenol hydroxylase
VVIVGAGMVGATLACALSVSSRLRVALVDSATPGAEWSPDKFDLRVSAISWASKRIFEALDVWRGMTKRRVTPFLEMRVWDSGGKGEIHFDSADLGEPAMGYIIENGVISQALLERLTVLSDVELVLGNGVSSVQVVDDQVKVCLADGRGLDAQLVVGADGARSRVRQMAGIETVGWRYDQCAVVANVTTALGHRETAWQRFLPDGPLAFLPLDSGECSIVWSTTPEHAQALLAMDDATFASALEVAFENRLGEITTVGRRASFPLQLQHATHYVVPRVALVGDAAHAIHPLAGQGANLGFLDAAALAEVLAEAAQTGADIGSCKVLRRYERWRKGDNLLTMSTMDGFKRSFGSANPGVRLARNLGLSAADHIQPVKHWFMRHAMGLLGDLPKLARGG